MAENFATLEYKMQEDVLTVIKHLTAMLLTTGMQMLELISPGLLLSCCSDNKHGYASQSSRSFLYSLSEE
jgi:cohesin loading factor subunit SCC2